MVLLRGRHDVAAGDDRPERARDLRARARALQAAVDDGCPFSKLGRTLDGAVDAYNKTVGSLERQVLVQARRFEQHGITGIEPPELQPIERQTRPPAAELVMGRTADHLGGRCWPPVTQPEGTSTVVCVYPRWPRWATLCKETP